MRGVNSVTLVGTLGRDPETRHTGEGTTVARLNLVTNRWDKRKGEEVRDWHRVTCFGKSAEYAEQYLRKGSKVAVSNARIEYGSYENKDGVTVYTTDIVAFDLQGVDSKKGSEDRRGSDRGESNRRGMSDRSRGRDGYLEDEDDIPF